MSIQRIDGKHPAEAKDKPEGYLYVDGAYLRKRCSEFCSQVLGLDGADVLPGIPVLLGWVKPVKTFYYDSVDARPIKDEDEAATGARVTRLRSYLDRLRALDDVHVFEGEVTGARANRRQKEVDVKITVDALMHAVRGNARTATIVAGDRDFRPLVSALVELGTRVYVYSARRGSHPLRLAADRFRYLDPTKLRDLTWRSESSGPRVGIGAHYGWRTAAPRSAETGVIRTKHGTAREVRRWSLDSSSYALKVSPGLFGRDPDVFTHPAKEQPGDPSIARAKEFLDKLAEWEYGAAPDWTPASS